jgi:lipopolysaccharide transport system permease protein
MKKTIISISKKKGTWSSLKELLQYKELFWFLAWRDILVRYKQTLIGIAWSVIRPLVTMLILTFVFGRLAKLPSDGIPYPLLVFTATLPWQFFSSAITEISNSVVINMNLVTKVYFPRIIIPSSSIIVCFVDFVIASSILFIMMIFYDFSPGINILFLPLFILLAALTAFGFGLLISALNVKYRDFRYIVPFLVQVGLYISPVGFNTKIIPDGFKFIYSLNPMVGVIDGFRWAILGIEQNFNHLSITISVIIVLLMNVFSVYYFFKSETKFADII